MPHQSATLCIAAALVIHATSLLTAQSLQSTVDIPSLIEMDEVKIADAKGPRVYVLKFPVSPNHESINGGLESLYLAIVGASGDWVVLDITSPELKQDELFDGPIAVEVKGDICLTGQANAKFVAPSTGGDTSVGLGIQLSAVATTSITASLLPPKETVVSSGTTNRNTGAFIRLKQTERFELENRYFVGILLAIRSTEGRETFLVNVNAKGRNGDERNQEFLALACVGGSDQQARLKNDNLIEKFEKAIAIRDEINKYMSQADAARNNPSFPYLGFGTKKATNLKLANECRQGFNDSLKAFQQVDPECPLAKQVAIKVKYD